VPQQAKLMQRRKPAERIPAASSYKADMAKFTRIIKDARIPLQD